MIHHRYKLVAELPIAVPMPLVCRGIAEKALFSIKVMIVITAATLNFFSERKFLIFHVWVGLLTCQCKPL